MNLQKIDKVYFIGIKGVGMSALAQIFSGLGVKVEGSDTEEKFFTDSILNRKGIRVHHGFDSNNLHSEFDLCVVSNAYLNKEVVNPEVKAARKLDLSLLTYAEALASLFNQAGLRLAVAGTHGKSTTTAMLGELLTAQLPSPPFCLVGTEVLDWKSNAWVPDNFEKGASLSDSAFLIEADEYKEAFLNYNPHLLVLTNIDFDHPDYFSDRESYLEAFVRLVERMEVSPRLDSSKPVVVARKGDADINKALNRVDQPLKVIRFEEPEKKLTLPVSPRVYQLNASAALKAAQVLGVPSSRAREALEQFGGTRRRLEKEKLQLKNKEIVFIDDYAHHPREIDSTLNYIFNNYPKRQVRVVFQPHTFSRSEAFLEDFAEILANVENLILTPTYGSARENQGKVLADDICEKIKLAKKESDPYCADSLKSAASYLEEVLEDGEVVLTLGAGDVWKLKKFLKGGDF